MNKLRCTDEALMDARNDADSKSSNLLPVCSHKKSSVRNVSQILLLHLACVLSIQLPTLMSHITSHRSVLIFLSCLLRSITLVVRNWRQFLRLLLVTELIMCHFMTEAAYLVHSPTIWTHLGFPVKCTHNSHPLLKYTAA